MLLALIWQDSRKTSVHRGGAYSNLVTYKQTQTQLIQSTDYLALSFGRPKRIVRQI